LPFANRYRKHQKIRIGYFSGDFRQHPVAYLTAGLYETHDREYFEIHAFSLGPDTKDEMNLRIKAGVDHFHNVQPMSHKEIVELARSLEIDIAVDLAGFTSGARTDIFAMSVAPIQLSYLGWLGTMGADYYDYLIADPVMIPEESQKYYVEKIIYLPSFQVNDSKDLPPDIVLTRKDVGLPEQGFVFCCFNNTYKFTPTTFDSWARILSEVDNSVLIVYANNDLSKKNLTKEIVQRGIASNRLIFGDSLDRSQYLSRYQVADLFLDTQPYNAGTTASDALKMGLPMLTLKGRSYQSRMGASILNALNLSELITDTPEEYEKLAIELATNPEKLKLIKDKLEINLSTAPLFDTKLFTKNIESAYKQIYDRSRKGQEPDHIYVE
jgi:predicted O-linked N-acetylglucosamine transferase (SPINDLY family)